MLICHTNTASIIFKEHSMIGLYGIVGCRGKIVIEKDVLMGQNIFISDSDHEYRNINLPVCKQGNVFIPINNGDPNIIIGEGSWIGRNSVIVGNVHIGKHCVIGANSVVTKNIPDYSVAVGSPAKVIKKYNFKTQIWEKVKS